MPLLNANIRAFNSYNCPNYITHILHLVPIYKYMCVCVCVYTYIHTYIKNIYTFFLPESQNAAPSVHVLKSEI